MAESIRKTRKGIQTVSFKAINRSQLKLKYHSKRTRTGAFKTRNRVKAH